MANLQFLCLSADFRIVFDGNVLVTRTCSLLGSEVMQTLRYIMDWVTI